MANAAFKSAGLASVAFVLGMLVANLSSQNAEATTPAESDIAEKRFLVSIDEIKRNFVFGEEFSGHYKTEVTLSDGQKRVVELTPMIHDGMKVVELKDTGGVTYMGLNGTTTNGTLMVQLRDMDAD